MHKHISQHMREQITIQGSNQISVTTELFTVHKYGHIML